MINKEIESRLFELRDEGYREFQSKLIPTVNAETVIGVRTPALRALAKEIAKRGDKDEFLNVLPHNYFDEYQLHAFVISLEKDFEKCLGEVEAFLPYVDNWATCDQLSPKVFKKHRSELLLRIKEWINSDRVYTVRFAVGMLMAHYLDEDFSPEYPEIVASIRSNEYYVNMMIAWYFATALAKQYDSVVKYLEQNSLDKWTHNKTIQKCVESYRVSEEHKAYLRTLRRK